jgi:hypothetical protein
MAELHVVAAGAAGQTAPGPLREWAGGEVPAGHVVRSGYVAIHDVVCEVSFGHQLLPAEVERAYRRQLELGSRQAWPAPTGWWREDGRFVLTDGRNRYVAALMLGVEHLLVAWVASSGEA